MGVGARERWGMPFRSSKAATQTWRAIPCFPFTKPCVGSTTICTAKKLKPQKGHMNYKTSLKTMDRATCEAIAVNQWTAQRFMPATVGLSTHVFGRMCSRAYATMLAAPRSRWNLRRSPHWDVSNVAPHLRSILEGYLLLHYLLSAEQDEDTQCAYVQTMHMYDCKKRMKILAKKLPEERKKWFEEQAGVISQRLKSTKTFNNLHPKTRKKILNGEIMMLRDRADVIKGSSLTQSDFDYHWNLLSQYSHLFSFSFYNVQPNGRGTGLENPFDVGAITELFQFGSKLLIASTNEMVAAFPDAEKARHGRLSQFSPGPLPSSAIRTLQIRFSQLRKNS